MLYTSDLDLPVTVTHRYYPNKMTLKFLKYNS